MLKIEKFVLMSPEQYQIVIEGMRNPKNSWNYIDSYAKYNSDLETPYTQFEFCMGDKDYKLCRDLAKGGSVHAKYRRMIPVWVTINAPLYWWKEFDTYKVGTVANSCSTMHKIQSKEFNFNDFSYDKLIVTHAECLDDCYDSMSILAETIKTLNHYRKLFLKSKDKKYWWQMIQLLPTSYNQKRTVMLNYEVLANIYESRRNHKLDEWHVVCDWIETLPYNDLITGKFDNVEE